MGWRVVPSLAAFACILGACRVDPPAKSEGSELVTAARNEAADITAEAVEYAEQTRLKAVASAQADYATELERLSTITQQEHARVLQAARAEAARITSSAQRQADDELARIVAAASQAAANAPDPIAAEEAARHAASTERQKTIANRVVECISTKVEHHTQDFTRPTPPYKEHVRAYFHFPNQADKAITGVQFDAEFFDSFGKSLHRASLQIDDRIEPSATSNPGLHWVWERNLFVADSPYEKLKSPAYAGTIRCTVTPRKVSFADGSIVDLAP